MTRELQPSDFQRTRWLGFSVTHGCWPYFYAAIPNPSQHELLWYSGGSIDVFADPNSAAWLGNSGDPTNTSGLINGVGGDGTADATLHTDQVDRVILNISGLSAALHMPGGYSANVSEWAGYIATTIANIRSKYPNVKMILLQPNIGGPGESQTSCTTADPNAAGFGVVRCTYTMPYIRTALLSVCRANVRMGFNPLASACSDFADWAGHLTTAAYQAQGQAWADYYASHL